jgi:hypothetical protein
MDADKFRSELLSAPKAFLLVTRTKDGADALAGRKDGKGGRLSGSSLVIKLTPPSPAKKPLYPKCANDKHVWVSGGALVCVGCGECTAFGKDCSLAESERHQLEPCGCHATFASSGCSLCGYCQRCGSNSADGKSGSSAFGAKKGGSASTTAALIQLGAVAGVSDAVDVVSGAEHSLVLLKSGKVTSARTHTLHTRARKHAHTRARARTHTHAHAHTHTHI